MNALKLRFKNQLKGAKSIFAWGISVSGVFLLVTIILKVIVSGVHENVIPWERVGLLWFIGFVLLIAGCRLAYKELPTVEQVKIIGSWLLWGLLVLGILFLARFFLVVLWDAFAGNAQQWSMEIILASLGLAIVVVCLGLPKLLSNTLGNRAPR